MQGKKGTMQNVVFNAFPRGLKLTRPTKHSGDAWLTFSDSNKPYVPVAWRPRKSRRSEIRLFREFLAKSVFRAKYQRCIFATFFLTFAQFFFSFFRLHRFRGDISTSLKREPFVLFDSRLLTFCYLAALNCWLLLCPAMLSHDWQMGSVPLVASLADTRNLATCLFFGGCLILTYKAFTDFEVSARMTNEIWRRLA